MSATESGEALKASISELAESYDKLHYRSDPIFQSQPAILSAITRLFGLESRPLGSARILELGSAAGGNIIPHAARYPQAEFVGVDIAPGQVAAGQARIDKLGLSNIKLLCKSVTDLDESIGSFDYIIAHGLYSWVPEAVQDGLLRVIRERLSPVGVACVSYNVLPGWRMMQVFRDALLLKAKLGDDPLAAVAAARDVLGFMSRHSVDPGPYGDLLRSWGERLAERPDHYLAHEYLEADNRPMTFQDFTDRAKSHRLGFLSEVGLATMNPDNYGPDAARYVRERASGDVIAAEQYLDLLSGRTLRQSLLVAEERLVSVDREIRPDRFSTLHYLPLAPIEVAEEPGKFVAKDSVGHWIATESRAVANALRRFAARYPSSSTFQDCVEGITGSDADAVRGQTLESLYRMLMVDMIALSAEPVRAGNGQAVLKASTLARADAAEGRPTTTNLRHEKVELDDAMRALLPMMDGTHDRAAIAALLARDGQPVTDAQLTAAVAAMARLGILEE